MSTLYAKTTSGRTLRVIYWNASDQVFSVSGATWVTWNNADIVNYKRTLTEAGTSGAYYPDHSPPADWVHATVVVDGTNAYVGTFDRTIEIAGSVSGNVGGNVTGSVGSVTGAVGSVTGAVGSVTGNVGGNVVGSVASVAVNGITANSIATDAINAGAIKADAVAKVQNGLATSTALAALAAVFEGITKLAQWLGLLAGKQAGDATARTELRATGAGSGGYDETTDSLQAIRDASFDPAATGVHVTKISNSTVAADRMAQLYGSLRVVLAEVGSTKSAIIVADEDGILDGDDDYRGLGMECVEGVNAGIIRRISSYDGDGPLVFAFSGLPTRGDAPWPYDPAEGDKFVIIGRPG